MTTTNPKVDLYLTKGCGRCSLYDTPQCKAIRWHDELQALRQIVLGCGLTEELKWSQPCYTYENRNVLMVTAFKEYASINFFKGVLLADPEGLLHSPGENSQAARLLKFTSTQEIAGLSSVIKAYIQEAIELEKAGRTVAFKTEPEPVPQELQLQLDTDPDLKQAFYALTPGRQRAYILHISGARQSTTRAARVERHRQRILAGKGLNDR